MKKIITKGDGLVVHVRIHVSSGCKVSDDEYEILFNGFNQPFQEADIEKIVECIREEAGNLGLKEETFADLTIREDGEWEDIFWHKYFLIECFSLHSFDGTNI